MDDWATNAINLILERLDKITETLERIAAALENKP